MVVITSRLAEYLQARSIEIRYRSTMHRYKTLSKRIDKSIGIYCNAYTSDPRFKKLDIMKAFDSVYESTLSSITSEDKAFMTKYNPAFESMVSQKIVANFQKYLKSMSSATGSIFDLFKRVNPNNIQTFRVDYPENGTDIIKGLFDALDDETDDCADDN